MRAQVEIKIDMGNAAFGEDGAEAAGELARLLRELARKVDRLSFTVGDTLPVIDVNGNRVGALTVRATRTRRRR